MTQPDDETTPRTETKKPKDILEQAVQNIAEQKAAQEKLKAGTEKPDNSH
jgi:hypothetical protein